MIERWSQFNTWISERCAKIKDAAINVWPILGYNHNHRSAPSILLPEIEP
jgi:hypothetical protein